MHCNFMDPRLHGDDKTRAMSFPWKYRQNPAYNYNVIPVKMPKPEYSPNVILVKTGIYGLHYIIIFSTFWIPAWAGMTRLGQFISRGNTERIQHLKQPTKN